MGLRWEEEEKFGADPVGNMGPDALTDLRVLSNLKDSPTLNMGAKQKWMLGFVTFPRHLQQEQKSRWWGLLVLEGWARGKRSSVCGYVLTYFEYFLILV